MAINYMQLRNEYRIQRKRPTMPLHWPIIALLALLIFLLVNGCAWASDSINIDKLANAIYIAEGGANTAHPFGILAKYKHTTARQACINTIKSAIKRYAKQDQSTDFITFLGATYCPVGAYNDPHGLNRNWVRNVTYYYVVLRNVE